MLQKTNSDKVRDSLMAAGVTERLATGIVDILLQAGCMQPEADYKASEAKHTAKIVPIAACAGVALPTLLLTYGQRTDVRQGRHHCDPHSSASPISIDASAGLLLLTPEMRVIVFKRNRSRMSFSPKLIANAPRSGSARTLH